MKIELNGQTNAFCRETFRQTKLIREQAECIVSDVYEDVGQIVSAETQLCLKSKDLTDHGVSIEGSADICVFYITDSRERVRCMHLTKEYRADFDCGEIGEGAAAQISLCTQGVQARALNPRKIAVQLSIRADLRCFSEDCLSMPYETAEKCVEGLQLRAESSENMMTVRAGEKSFTINEQLPLRLEGEPTGIVFASAALVCTEKQLIGSKALIKGSAELRFCFEMQEGPLPLFQENTVPFSVLIDMPDENCRVGSVVLTPTALYADLSSAINDSRMIELELHAVAQTRVDRRGKLLYLSDAYSTRCPVELETNSTTLCRSCGAERFLSRTTETLRAENENTVVAEARAELLSFAARDGKAEASAAVSLLLREEDGSYSAQQKLLSFEAPLPEMNEELLFARIAELSVGREGDEIKLDAAVEMECSLSEKEEIRFLSSIELDETNMFDLTALPSLTVAKRAGRDLWELAKTYHSSTEAIAELGEKFPISGDILLVPRV